MAARQIPGFTYDPSTGKYFKATSAAQLGVRGWARQSRRAEVVKQPIRVDALPSVQLSVPARVRDRALHAFTTRATSRRTAHRAMASTTADAGAMGQDWLLRGAACTISFPRDDGAGGSGHAVLQRAGHSGLDRLLGIYAGAGSCLEPGSVLPLGRSPAAQPVGRRFIGSGYHGADRLLVLWAHGGAGVHLEHIGTQPGGDEHAEPRTVVLRQSSAHTRPEYYSHRYAQQQPTGFATHRGSAPGFAVAWPGPSVGDRSGGSAVTSEVELRADDNGANHALRGVITVPGEVTNLEFNKGNTVLLSATRSGLVHISDVREPRHAQSAFSVAQPGFPRVVPPTAQTQQMLRADSRHMMQDVALQHLQWAAGGHQSPEIITVAWSGTLKVWDCRMLERLALRGVAGAVTTCAIREQDLLQRVKKQRPGRTASLCGEPWTLRCERPLHPRPHESVSVAYDERADTLYVSRRTGELSALDMGRPYSELLPLRSGQRSDAAGEAQEDEEELPWLSSHGLGLWDGDEKQLWQYVYEKRGGGGSGSFRVWNLPP